MKLTSKNNKVLMIYGDCFKKFSMLGTTVIISILMMMGNGCNGSKKKEENQVKDPAISDSISKEIKTSEVADENIAYKNIKFGIGKSEYNNLKESDTININASDKYLVKPLFDKNDQLIELDFEGVTVYSSWFNDPDHLCVKQLDNFYQKLKEKYGESPILKSFRVDYIDDSWSNVWDIGKKKISIGIRTKTGPKYNVICSILDTIAKKEYIENLENEKKLKDKQNKDSAIKKNPF